MTSRKKRRAVAKAAGKVTGGLREYVIAKPVSAKAKAGHERRRMGKLGAASPVVRIDPKTGERTELP